jgi:uncharacterized FlaG/YvyC family protein
MTVKLYVDWIGKEIITEKELEKIVAERQLDRREDKDCMAEDIDDFLDRYGRYEIFSFTEKEKNEIIEQVNKESDEWVRDNVLADYNEISIEV